ncbi:hypothetical protein ACTFIY_002584 [Dictyostelium cf. discoideum]
MITIVYHHNHLSIDPLYFQSKLFEYNQKNNNLEISNKDRAIKTAKIAGAAVTGAPVLFGMTGGLAAPFIGMMLNFVGGAGSIVSRITGATGLSATMLSVIFGVAGAKVSAGAMISATSGGGKLKIIKFIKLKDRVIRSVTDDYGDILMGKGSNVKIKTQLVSEYQGTIVQASALVPLLVLKAASVLDNP